MLMIVEKVRAEIPQQKTKTIDKIKRKTKGFGEIFDKELNKRKEEEECIRHQNQQ